MLVADEEGFDAASPDFAEVYHFMQDLGYRLAAKLLLSLIFVLPGRLDGGWKTMTGLPTASERGSLAEGNDELPLDARAQRAILGAQRLPRA